MMATIAVGCWGIVLVLGGDRLDLGLVLRLELRVSMMVLLRAVVGVFIWTGISIWTAGDSDVRCPARIFWFRPHELETPMIMVALDLSSNTSSSTVADDDSPVLLLTRLGERAFAGTRLVCATNTKRLLWTVRRLASRIRAARMII